MDRMLGLYFQVPQVGHQTCTLTNVPKEPQIHSKKLHHIGFIRSKVGWSGLGNQYVRTHSPLIEYPNRP